MSRDEAYSFAARNDVCWDWQDEPETSWYLTWWVCWGWRVMASPSSPSCWFSHKVQYLGHSLVAHQLHG